MGGFPVDGHNRVKTIEVLDSLNYLITRLFYKTIEKLSNYRTIETIKLSKNYRTIEKLSDYQNYRTIEKLSNY